MLFRALVLFIAGLVGLIAACGVLREADSPAVKLFHCAASAFLPVAGTYERAEEIVLEVQAGRVSVPDVLAAAQATASEAEALESALRECAAAAAAKADAGAP